MYSSVSFSPYALSDAHFDAVMMSYRKNVHGLEIVPDFDPVRVDPYLPLSRALARFTGPIEMVRHGPTIYSEKQCAAGGISLGSIYGMSGHILSDARENVRLSPEGERKTHEYAESAEGNALRKYAHNANVLTFVSPAQRTVYTAQIILKDAPWRLCPCLNERYLGNEHGQPVSIIGANVCDINYVPVGSAETAKAHIDRVVRTFVQHLEMAIAENRKGLLYICHGGEVSVKLSSIVALTAGLVNGDGWSGVMSPCQGLEISPLKNGKRHISRLQLASLDV